MSLPPWHMWGSSGNVTVPCTGISQPNAIRVSSQLVQVNYARPDTWNFICEAKLIECSIAAPAPSVLEVIFPLTIGVGRSTVALPLFVVFRWDPSTEVGVQRYSTVAVGPPRFTGDLVPNLLEDITAQSIQARADVTWFGTDIGATCNVEVTMHVAPAVHLRPEWHLERHAAQQQFPGAEHKGH